MKFTLLRWLKTNWFLSTCNKSWPFHLPRAGMEFAGKSPLSPSLSGMCQGQHRAKRQSLKGHCLFLPKLELLPEFSPKHLPQPQPLLKISRGDPWNCGRRAVGWVSTWPGKFWFQIPKKQMQSHTCTALKLPWIMMHWQTPWRNISCTEEDLGVSGSHRKNHFGRKGQILNKNLLSGHYFCQSALKLLFSIHFKTTHTHLMLL